MPKMIEITVSPTGEVTLETRGFHGKACQEASRGLEAALGRVTAETLTPEFHRPAPISSKQGPVVRSSGRSR